MATTATIAELLDRYDVLSRENRAAADEHRDGDVEPTYVLRSLVP